MQTLLVKAQNKGQRNASRLTHSVQFNGTFTCGIEITAGMAKE